MNQLPQNLKKTSYYECVHIFKYNVYVVQKSPNSIKTIENHENSIALAILNNLFIFFSKKTYFINLDIYLNKIYMYTIENR